MAPQHSSRFLQPAERRRKCPRLTVDDVERALDKGEKFHLVYGARGK